MNAKSTGRIAALLAASVVVGLVLWSELSRRGADEPRAEQSIPELPELPDDASPSDINRPEGITDLIELGEQGVWTNDDPEFGLIRLRWEALDPKPNGVFDLRSPHATITLEDRRIVIDADAGTLLWPARGLDQDREPESGTLTGDVSISLYDGHEPVEDETPVVRMTTPALSFDTTLGEIKTPERITITGDRLRYSGVGLTLRYSQAPRRLTLLRVDSDSEAIIQRTPQSAQPDANDEQTPSADATPDGTGDETDAQVDIYRLTLREDVRLRSEIAEMEAEEFLVFARLLDGELPDGAIAEFRSTLDPQVDSPAGNSGADDRQASAAEDEPVRLDWSGPLEVRPLRDEPGALETEDLHLTIRSPTTNRVMVTDLSSGATLRCVSLEYGATTRNLSVLGIGGIGVRADIPGAGEALFGRLDVDLTTGQGSIPGPIRVSSRHRDEGEAGGGPLELTALDGATFRLDTRFGPVGADGIIDPIEVVFNGRVEASDRRYTVSGDAARALFTRREQSSPSVDPRLARILVNGEGLVTDARTDDRIAADTLDLMLDTDAPSGELVPASASARGDARATRGDESIEARIIESEFTRTDAGETELATVGAVDDVVAINDGGVRLEAARLDADERSGRVFLEGSPVRVTSREAGAERTFTAQRAQYDRRGRTLTVFSGGTAAQRTGDPTSDEFDAIDASWQQGMTYDERTGRIELRGGVELSAERTGVERHTARADLATIHVSPSSEGGARFLGADLESFDGDEPVVVELKRFKPSDRETTQRLANLKGPRIELDATSETIDVSGAGALLVHDNTTERTQQANEKEDDGLFESGARGSTLFEWEESLAFARPQGLATMRGRVRVLHRAAGASEVTQLECETLEALLSEPPEGVEGEPSLVRVDATDAVYAKHGPVEIVADVMTFLAPSERIVARAKENNRVTIRDEDEGRHISADAVSLDVRSGDWTIEDVDPVTSTE